MSEDGWLGRDGDTFSPIETREEARTRRNQAKSRNKAFISVAIACTLVSGMFGFAGGYVSGHILRSNAATNLVSETELPTDSTPHHLSLASAKSASSDKDLSDALLAHESVSGEGLSVVAIASTVKETVVEITTETVVTSGRMRQFIREGAGSGVIVSADGVIVTSNHVVSGARSIVVRLTDGTEYPASLVGGDAKTDLAVIRIAAPDLIPAVLGDSSALMIGETVLAVGNPLGSLGGTVTGGILSALDRAITIDGESMRLLQTDAAVNPGNSGGGLFNLYGELIGIVNAKSSGTGVEGLGFAIPINTAKSVVESIIEHGHARGRVDVGLAPFEAANPEIAATNQAAEQVMS